MSWLPIIISIVALFLQLAGSVATLMLIAWKGGQIVGRIDSHGDKLERLDKTVTSHESDISDLNAKHAKHEGFREATKSFHGE